MSRIQVLFSVPWPLHFEIHFAGPTKSSINMCSTLPKGCHRGQIKRLSPRSNCYCFSNVYCFILECLEFKYFSVFRGPSTLKSISPALPNLALTCVALYRKLISLRCVLVSFFVRFITCNDLPFQFFFLLFI